MNTGWKNEHETDKLLNQVLRDDLPAETEFRMRKRLSAFRRALRASEGRGAERSAGFWGSTPGFARWRALHPAFRTEILACASAVMLAAGMMMHLGGYRSVLADSISLLKISVAVSEEMRFARSMECTVRMPAEGAQAATYHIRWVRDAGTRVDVESPPGIGRTVWVIQGRTTLAGDAADAPRLEEPLVALLSPADLATSLDERWQLRPEAGRHNPDRLIFADRQDGAVIEVELDKRTFLPVSLVRKPSRVNVEGGGSPSMSAAFLWNPAIAPELMVPGLESGK